MYAATSLIGKAGSEYLQKAVEALLATVKVVPQPTVLWAVRYQQSPSSGSEPLPTGDHVLRFPPPSLDLAFDDTVLDNVKEIWQQVAGNDAGEFLVFAEREAYADDEE